MPDIETEVIRAALFTDPAVKAAHDVQVYRTFAGHLRLTATISVAAPEVDLTAVRATIKNVLATQFELNDVELTFRDPGAPVVLACRSHGALEKK